jgi:single-strand DNA-binding protein
MLKVIGNFNLGADATVNTVNGKTVINFNAAHSESYTDASGVRQDRSVWANFSWWSEKTNIVQYLKKGVSVLVDGVPSAVLYENRDKVKVAQLQVRINYLQLLSKQQQRDSTPETTTQEPLDQETPF